MQYRKDKNGNPISLLGFGCMRFTRKGSSIDLPKAEKEIMLAIENGVNYFDTAYIYPGSEAAIGEIFEKNNVREKIKIATKLPPYLLKSPADIDKYFEEELKRLRTDYVDYYLMHMLTDTEVFRKLEKLGIKEWIEEKKKSGQIRNVGFSFHGNTETFIEILNAYDWDFTQIQYNYLDEHTQAGRKGLEAAHEKGIPVIIMEPLRGGKLVTGLPQEALDVMKESGKDWSTAEWALRWLWDQPGVTCVLSGMNSEEMVLENCRIASDCTENFLTKADLENYDKIKEAIKANTFVPCTACRYCMPCPKGVDIPCTFSSYNNVKLFGKGAARREYWQTVGLRKESAFPSQCVECGKCEQHCPQGIEIRKKLKEADKVLLPWYYKLFAKASRKFLFRKTKNNKAK